MIILIITGLFLYLTTLHILHKANEQFMADEIGVLSHLLETQPNNLLTLKQEVIESSYIETNSEYRYYIRILDENNRTILQSPHFNQALNQTIFLKYLTEKNEKKMIHWHSDSNNFLLMQTKSRIGHTNKTVLIQVALDITYQKNIVAYYSKWLILTIIFIMLIAACSGYLIANRAMQSLYRLTETAEQITASSLHQRIDPKSWPEELKKLGMAFNDMLARIENAVTHLTQFSGDLAHELRTPINNLMGETEIILSRPHQMAEYQNVLESHFEELQRLSHIIENILFLARTENPKLNLKKELVHVSNEIQLICDYYQAVADEKNIKLSIKGDTDLTVNPVMFRRMLSNLLSNALKYTPPHGSIQFSIKESHHMAEITLTDNGIGIAPDHLPKLFNRFYRVDSARTRAAGGVGLGLSIVKSIVDLHHGTISIRSEIDKGSVITLIFPKHII